MSLQRSATRKAASGPARRKKDYDIVQQGIKELYPLDKPNVEPEIDIVFVPGLGAHPEESWVSPTTGFNWTTNGLVRDFPRARILLYMYESAWTGSLKVRAFMSNIAMSLLSGLKSKREGHVQRRPIVFIGHSMGGLVIAKAITLADSRRDKFPIMFEAIAAAVFFGTPFNGAEVASVAAMYAQFAEMFNTAVPSKLLDLMKPGDEGLHDLRHTFMRLVGKLHPKIDLMCFFEQEPTDFSNMGNLPNLLGLTKFAIPKKYADFVTRESATLAGVEEQGLACNHRNLVKFDGPKDDKWLQYVKDPLKRILHGAQLAVKNRLNSVRDIDRPMINNIFKSLSAVDVDRKRKALAQTFVSSGGITKEVVVSSSWVTKELEYKQWLAESGADEVTRPGDCLWIRGPEGRGKTLASLAAIDEINKLIEADEEKGASQGPILLAYFFCDPTTDFSTAEDLLKSLVTQLINGQNILASYAKSFAKRKSEGKAQVTVENLWQTLQDMLTDEFIGRKVIFVLNNLHALPEDSDSTIKFMKYLNTELQSISSANTKRVPTRWMITSREAHNIEEALKVEGVRLVDLEDEKYGGQVQTALRKRAKERVATLEKEKSYNKALSYFASSLIGKRAQNTQWIDITCVQLEELPEAESDLNVRRVLENMPQDLTMLLNNAWLQIFKANEADVEKIKEMLRTLVLTYEDPTEPELGVLAGLWSTDQEKADLRKFIENCKPLLIMERASNTVCFMNVVVKTHLLENSKQLLGMSEEEKRWQHGVLALRSFSHLNDQFSFPEPEPKPEENPDESSEEEDEDDGSEDSEDDEEDDEEEEEDESESESESDDDSTYEEDPEADVLRDLALPYTVKYWLRHASKATREIAEDLSLEKEFWNPESRIRRRWLVEYCRMTSTFDEFDYKTMTGLHIAAAVGFRELVAALIRNDYEEQVTIRDSLVNTPLHFAAFFGRPKIVEELLNRGAVIDDGDEIQEQTPLHMAALSGHLEVMRKLLLRGANANATSNDIGPVVNAAISSGNRACVELLVERGVSLTIDRNDLEAPLAQAALLSDISMFEYLIEKYADKLPPGEYSKALAKAAEAGRLDVFNRLLEFEYGQQDFQNALKAAVEEWNWDIVTAILEKRTGLNCDDLFYEVATCSEPQDKLLEVIWQYANGSISQDALNRSLYDATDREKDTTVKLLLENYKANPNATGDEYGNALTAAAYDGTIHIIELLLEAGADVNAPEGWAIQTAASEGHYDVVELLIKHGANVNAFSRNENFEAGTALQGACEAGRKDIVSLLLQHGVDPNLGGGSEAPPMLATAIRAEEEILELLVKAKARIDVLGCEDNTSTPLISAAAYMPQSSLQLLLDAGADINLQDGEGDTALIIAASRGDADVVSFLLDNGADIMHSNKEGDNALKTTEDDKCRRVLIDRVSVLLQALKTSMDSGNAVVTSIVRKALGKPQELNYDDEPQSTTEAVEEAETPVEEVADEAVNHASQYDCRETHDDNKNAQPSESPIIADDIHELASFDEHSSFNDMSEQLKAALANQTALWNQFTNEPTPAASVEPEHPEYQPESPQEQAIQLPIQGYIKRKPAPNVSYNHAPYSKTPSPKLSESSNGRYRAPSESNSSSQINAYKPDQEATPQPTTSYQSSQFHTQQNQSVSSQSSESYQSRTSYQQAQPTQYQKNNGPLYDSSNYGGSAPYQNPAASQYPAQQSTFVPYNPDSYRQPQPAQSQRPPQQQPQQHAYKPSDSTAAHGYSGPAYQPPDWQQGGYFANGSAGQHQQYEDNMYGGADWDQPRPQLKQRGSSFFSGAGVKNTFDKAKVMGNGMFSRK
ncbi:hypothetical protein GGR52DRAFT_478508 [Hypoxylon sp. FL1284]|nr:hypothetical protein GGR52DRAFT_478508 [Hypoxylon sp. FL1284]